MLLYSYLPNEIWAHIFKFMRSNVEFECVMRFLYFLYETDENKYHFINEEARDNFIRVKYFTFSEFKFKIEENGIVSLNFKDNFYMYNEQRSINFDNTFILSNVYARERRKEMLMALNQIDVRLLNNPLKFSEDLECRLIELIKNTQEEVKMKDIISNDRRYSSYCIPYVKNSFRLNKEGKLFTVCGKNTLDILHDSFLCLETDEHFTVSTFMFYSREEDDNRKVRTSSYEWNINIGKTPRKNLSLDMISEDSIFYCGKVLLNITNLNSEEHIYDTFYMISICDGNTLTFKINAPIKTKKLILINKKYEDESPFLKLHETNMISEKYLEEMVIYDPCMTKSNISSVDFFSKCLNLKKISIFIQKYSYSADVIFITETIKDVCRYELFPEILLGLKNMKRKDLDIHVLIEKSKKCGDVGPIIRQNISNNYFKNFFISILTSRFLDDLKKLNVKIYFHCEIDINVNKFFLKRYNEFSNFDFNLDTEEDDTLMQEII